MTVSQQVCEGKKKLSAFLGKKYLGETGIFNAVLQDRWITSTEILSRVLVNQVHGWWAPIRRGRRKVIWRKREGREDTEGLSSPGTDSSGKAGAWRAWDCCLGGRWEDKRERGRGQAGAVSDIRAMLAQINNYKLTMNIFWLEIRWRSLSKVRSGYRNSSVHCNVMVAYLMEGSV